MKNGKTYQTCQDFILKRANASGSNCASTGREFLSYATIIARHKDNKILLSNKKYSMTTSKQQNGIKDYARQYGVEVVLVSHETLNA